MQVVLHPEFGTPPRGILAWTWVTLILASAGLIFLYKTTTADPGFLPCGLDETHGKEKVTPLPHQFFGYGRMQCRLG